MLSGDNGILQRATQSKERTERAEIIETAKMDILAKITEKKGENITEDELKDILTSTDYATQGTLSDNGETSILDKTLISKDEKYEISVSEIYNGTLKINSKNKSTADLQEGDIVYYKDASDKDIECIVLYDSKNANYSTYGVQIIPRNSVITKELGNSSYNLSKESYNNAINILNTEAETYVRANPKLSAIAESSRCVGSLPNNPAARNTEKYSHIEGTNNYFGRNGDDGQFEAGEEDGAYTANNTTNYTVDLAQLEALNINDITDSTNGSNYWLASRMISGDSIATGMVVRSVDSDGNLSGNAALCVRISQGNGIANTRTYGVRPCITLKSSVKITEVNGKTYLIIE